MKCSLFFSNFLEDILIFPIILFSSISLHWSLRKGFLSLIILWNSVFKWVYLSFSSLPFTSHLFTAIWKTSSDNQFDFLHLFFLGMILIPASCTMTWTSFHSSSGSTSSSLSSLKMLIFTYFMSFAYSIFKWYSHEVKWNESVHLSVHVWLCNAMVYSLTGSSFHRILQARTLDCVTFTSPGALSFPGIKPGSPTLQAYSLLSELPGKSHTTVYIWFSRVMARKLSIFLVAEIISQW